MKQVTIYMAVIALLLFSCNNNRYQKNKSTLAEEKPGMTTAYEKYSDQNKADTARSIRYEETDQSKNSPSYIDWDKKIIKTAEVSLELKNYAAYNQKIHNGLRAFGAYIAAEEQNFSDDRAANTIVIKVPVEQFENLMNSFAGDSIKVLQKKISSEDVSAEMVDTKSRMVAKKQMHDRYLELLKQAKNMKEILEVQQEINSIQEEIESAGGRMNYLGHQSAYSTIHLQYFQYLNPNSSSANKTTGYLVQLKEGFQIGISVIGSLLIFVVTIWPLILAGLLGVFFWKRNKAKTAKV